MDLPVSCPCPLGQNRSVEHLPQVSEFLGGFSCPIPPSGGPMSNAVGDEQPGGSLSIGQKLYHGALKLTKE